MTFPGARGEFFQIPPSEKFVARIHKKKLRQKCEELTLWWVPDSLGEEHFCKKRKERIKSSKKTGFKSNNNSFR